MSHILLQQVLEFHKKYKKTIGDLRYPNVAAEQDFRLGLIDEEREELQEALEDPSLTERERIVKVADALGDMAYVIFGAAVCWGIDLATVLDAIHVSNMTKSLGEKRSDGKVLKGENYQPPQIQQALELAAYDISKDGYGDDSWWPVPTAVQGEECFYPQALQDEFAEEEPTLPREVTDKIMLAAKEQAKILAMKDIQDDLVPDIKSSGLTKDGRPYSINAKSLQEVLGASDEEMKQIASELATSGVVDQEIHGEMTAYGAYVFDCPCGRKHAVQARLGSRGGLAPKGKAECMCGKAFVIDFSSGEPKVKVTTIEELRKVDNV